MYECSYKYAVIEKTADGVHGGWGHRRKEYWYEWESDDNTYGNYVPIEKPEELKHVIGWGIG